MSKGYKCEMKTKRVDMYKTRTPPWKETYRQRCLERLRENRAQHQLARRCLQDFTDYSTNVEIPVDDVRARKTESYSENPLLDNIMQEEWERLRRERENEELDELEKGALPVDAMCGLYEDIYDEIRKEIESDLRKEELQLLSLQSLCDEHVDQEEQLCLALESLSTEEVICPLCEKSSLIENRGFIICQCGLRICTEHDCISLQNVRDSLNTGIEEHSRICEAKPDFSLTHKFGISNLLMDCKVCDFLYVII